MEVRVNEARAAEVCAVEVRGVEVRVSEVRLPEVRLDIRIPLSPLVPSRSALFENRDMFGIGHGAPNLIVLALGAGDLRSADVRGRETGAQRETIPWRRSGTTLS